MTWKVGAAEEIVTSVVRHILEQFQVHTGAAIPHVLSSKFLTSITKTYHLDSRPRFKTRFTARKFRPYYSKLFGVD